jgi:hypothetical protein
VIVNNRLAAMDEPRQQPKAEDKLICFALALVAFVATSALLFIPPRHTPLICS